MSFTADRLLLFGATGDLAQRMLLPSLFALDADGLLAPDLKIIGTARSDMSDAEYRNFARAALEKYLPAERRGSMAAFLNRLSYQTLDATTLEGYTDLAAKRGATVQEVAAARGCDQLRTRVADGEMYELNGWKKKAGPIALPGYCG